MSLAHRLAARLVLFAALLACVASNAPGNGYRLYETLPLADAPMPGTLTAAAPTWSKHFRVHAQGTDTIATRLEIGVTGKTTQGAAVPLVLTLRPLSGSVATRSFSATPEGTYASLDFESPCRTSPCTLDATVDVRFAGAPGSAQVALDWIAHGVLDGSGNVAPVATSVDLEVVP